MQTNTNINNNNNNNTETNCASSNGNEDGLSESIETGVQSQEVSANQQQQAQQQPQTHLRTSKSPDQQQQQLQQQQPQQLLGPDSTSNDMSSDVYQHQQQQQLQQHQQGSQSAGGGYHNQRQRSQSYHNQQHQHQHHHHQHQHQQQQSQHQVQHYHPNKYNNPRGGDNESNPNHVLLLTVINPHYSITCDLIHQIFSAYGKVNRIVIFKKNGVQAMVEFDNVESAKRAKTMLYGCDIYSGCCTLRIEYAKPTRLNIHRNGHDSFDYTNPNLSGGSVSDAGGDGGGGGASLDEHEHQQQQHHQSSSNLNHGHSMHGYSSTHGSHHPQRGDRGQGGSIGGGVGGSGGGGGHNQHSRVPHYHSSRHHHSQSNTPQHQIQQSPVARSPDLSVLASNYEAVTPQNDQSTDAFHQDGGYNISRGGGGPQQQQQQPQQPPLAYVGADSYMPVHGAQPHHGHHGNVYSRQDGHHHQQHPHHHPRGGPNHGSSGYSAAHDVLMGPISLPPPQGTVMMVYGLQPERVNCDKLFNLFCLYGNVVRVKFLKTKEGCAMVQMGDLLSVDRCVNSLNKSTLFGSELQISYSKQAFLHDVMQPFTLPDGSPSYKDYMGNKNNRFKNPEVASKNRILPPSQVLHFFNAPFGITEDELVHLFKETAGHEPISIKIFSPRPDNSKSYSGLVTFKDPAEATDSLVLCNHLSMPKPGAQAHPHILRLCFSPPAYMRQSHYPGNQAN